MSRRFSVRGAVGLLMLFGLVVHVQADDPPKTNPPKGPVPKDKVHEKVQTDKPGRNASVLPVGYLSQEAWLKAAITPLEAGEVDRLVNAALKKSNVAATALTTDEQFIRRVTLDLTGRLPDPKEITDFINDKKDSKRAALVDKLLESPDFTRHWSAYFREVISSRVQAGNFGANSRSFETWLGQQLKDNKSWAEITKTILNASGQVRFDQPDKNGEIYFLLSRRGADAQTEIAAETSRIFLGIQIQCAQCHDHPSDIWKRKQFHEFAAYFARMKDRFVFEEKRIVGTQLVSLPFGEHRMPMLDDPKKSTTISPRFIDGKAPARSTTTDADRRKALAEAIISKDNPWFAGAFVNRIWGELMGQAFYTPIDDMGPEKEAIMPEVLARVAGSFRGGDYNIKQVFRDLCATEAYQRQIRPGELDDHELFAARHVARMSGSALYKALTNALGGLNVGGFAGKGPVMGGGRFGGGIETLLRQEFAFDPSTRPRTSKAAWPRSCCS
jgi:hypothetical protein